MAIEIKKVSEVTESERQQREEILQEFIADAFPDVDVSPGGVLHGRVLLPEALLSAIAADNFIRLRQSQSIRLVEQNPEIAEPDIIDNILSNFLVSRQAGSTASGRIVIVLASKQTTVIASGTRFNSGELGFVTTRAFTGVIDAGLIQSDSDRLIQQRPDGTFSFVVDVVAEAVGDQSRLKADTPLELASPPSGFVKAFAEQDFTGGFAEQTNEDLIGQLALGVSTKVLGGRINIESLLRGNFPRIQHVSIVGLGDAEMTRDRNNIFAISHGSKSDTYLAPDIRPSVTVLTLEATQVDTDQKTMQINFGKSVLPGFYGVTKVLRQGDEAFGTLEILSVARGIDATGTGFIPELPRAIDAAFSAFQTAELRFKDPAILVTETTRTYDVSILGMPDIADIQALVSDRGQHNPNADYLIKAAVPMITGVSIVINKLAAELSDQAELDELEAAIQVEVANRVNAIGFTLGRLPASLVTAAAASVLTGSASVRTPVELTATLIRPDGISQPFFSTDRIVVPSDPEDGVSQRTVVFFLDPNDVLVVFNDLDVVEV